jgi:tetratricopeptide (TPR) repeat protein
LTRGTTLAAGAALVLLADVPGVFTRGDVLRGALLPLYAALALLAGVSRAGRFARADLAALGLLVLPLGAAVPGVLGIERPSLGTPAALARALTPWLSLPALALGLWRCWAGAPDLLRAWRWLLGAGLAAAGWVYVEVLTSDAVAGPFGRPGVAGPVLGALLGPALLLPWTKRTIVRAAAAALLIAACWFTQSRTGLAAAAVSALLAAALAPSSAVAAPVRRGALALLALGGVGAALLLAGVVEPQGAVTLKVRQGVWRAAVALAEERPLVGHGHGSFRSEVLRVRDLEEARLSRGREPFMAHSDVLHAAAEGGVPAAALLLLFGVAALALALAASRAGGGDPWAGAALALLAAQVAAGLAEQVLPDPAHALLAAAALATVLARRSPAKAAAPRGVVRLAAWVGALALIGVFALRAREIPADAHVRAFREAAAPGVTVQRVAALARERLVEGALRWRPDHADALHLLGVAEAEQGRMDAARARWHEALAVEPGLTAARLDVAQSYVQQGRPADAQAALLEARRADPTRYDVVLRQGHVALGPEPVPGAPPEAPLDPLEPLRRYNQAAELAPGRFETEVAYARVARRMGDLDGAGHYLRSAQRIAGEAGEVLYEAFHLAEAEGRADERLLAAFLTLALVADPALATPARREAAACYEAGLRGTSKLAFRALSVRVLALLTTGDEDPRTVASDAARHAAEGRHEASVALRRALLAHLGDAPPDDAREHRDFYRRRGDLLVATAQSASRFDGALARALYAEGHLLKGLEYLEEGALPEARRWLEKARDDAPDDERPRAALERLDALERSRGAPR